MKIKDFFSKTAEQGSIKEHVEFIEKLPDFDIPDEFFPAFENSFLTRDRALADTTLTKRLKADILDPIDQDIISLLKELNHPDVGKVESERSTYNRMAMVKKIIPEVIAKSQKDPDNDETKKQLQSLKRINEEWETKYQSRESDHKKQLDEEKKKFDNDIRTFKLDTELEKMSSKYTFAEAYDKNREALQKALLGDLKQKNMLQYTVKENGESAIQVLEPGEDGTPRPKFNGNSPVTIKSLLDEVYKPFLKVSNGQEGQQPNPQTQVIQPPQFQGTAMPRRNTG